MRYYKAIISLLALTFGTSQSYAQYAWQETEREKSKLNLKNDVEYNVEMQASMANNKTPLWLNANKYGLSSLEKNNGYMRAAVIRPLQADSVRRWAIGYCLDMAAAMNYTSDVVVQQAYVEARWLHGVLTVGAKEYPMELKNQKLSSGSQTLGINARPVPQVRLALPQYWQLPIGGGWLHLKGHIAYGMMTDDSWQHEFTGKQSKYADNVLYHSKAGYLKIGNEYSNFPISVELGLEMASQFGGKPYLPSNDGMVQVPTESGLKSFWNAFVPGGQDASDGVYGNKEGNVLGSWLMRINYDHELWRFSVYADHFFEDHSQMFLVDYNGYGEGEEWNVWKKHRYFMYSLRDMMFGGEFHMKYGTWLRNIVLEYIYTKYQSGPYNHDRTQNISDHVAGLDDYYNHTVYPGWQHWGQVMGNPLFRSPIYNTDGNINVRDNRFGALHLGISGQPTERLDYRLLGTYQEGWGTYDIPFTRKHHNISFLVETGYRFNHGWKARLGYAMDFGSQQMLGHNAGAQLTISKSGVF